MVLSLCNMLIIKNICGPVITCKVNSLYWEKNVKIIPYYFSPFVIIITSNVKGGIQVESRSLIKEHLCQLEKQLCWSNYTKLFEHRNRMSHDLELPIPMTYYTVSL